MPVEESSEVVKVDIDAVANIKNFSTIPNSNSEFCIYTYKAEYETYNQLTRVGFFNPAYSFLNVGDTIRVFLFNIHKELTNYLEYLVVSVDKINKKVVVATITNQNIEKKIIG